MTNITYKTLDPKRVGFIAVHCSATKPSQNFTVKDIRRMHLQRGFVDVGYHYIIRRDGVLEKGRPIDRQGAHVERYNHLSVGVCLIGGVSETEKEKNGNPKAEDNFTPEQWAVLKEVLAELKIQFPHATIQGHRDFPHVNKDCPCFDVKHELESGRLK